MSEAEAAEMTMPDRVFETRQPFDLSDEVQARVDALDLADTVQHVKDNGYGYVYDAAPIEFVERVREAILRIVKAGEGGVPGGASMLLTKDPVFADVVLNPKMLALAEVLCGKGAMLSQLAGSVKPKSDKGDTLGLHADQNWTPAPFPVHNQLVTFCWALDDFSKETGSTKVIPKSHLLRRHPNEQETNEEKGIISTECAAGTIVFWDGSTWHSGGGHRSVDGERVVLHLTYSRLALRPVESYDFLGEDWLADKPYEMRVLLGREDFLNTPEGGFAHGEKLPRAMNWAKT
jgi:ectoine hydroxylase-related dioxygenase (phytanoyl-CoA dioxygenase family)